MKKRCMACNGELFPRPLVRYRNMPRAAQRLPDAAHKERGVSIDVYQCRYCGLVQLPIRPVSYYKQVIRSAGFSQEMRRFRNNQFRRFVARYGLRHKKIIEIGCGRGEYLSVMRRYCRNSHGIENSKGAVAACRAAGLCVTEGFVDKEAYRISGEPFDAFIMLNFLEHLPRPYAVLRGIYNNLAADAVGIIEVPNFDLTLDEKIFNDFSTEHLAYFTSRTLRHVVEMSGFEVMDMRAVWHDNILSAVVHKRTQASLDDFKDRQKSLQQALNDYWRKTCARRVAVWGAGHQSFTLLSQLNLKFKVTYVVDSAAFKQGRFTPVTHLPIVAPGMLNDNPVDAAIVMASSYSDEVVGILKRRFKHIKHIAVLRGSDLEIIS
ncbi:MAG: methyltransferase domain-containing protein [Candidatus Velamenicoccus archaeovorus]